MFWQVQIPREETEERWSVGGVPVLVKSVNGVDIQTDHGVSTARTKLALTCVHVQGDFLQEQNIDVNTKQEEQRCIFLFSVSYYLIHTCEHTQKQAHTTHT